MSIVPIQSLLNDHFVDPFFGIVQPSLQQRPASLGMLDDVHRQMNRLNRMAQQMSSDLAQQGMGLGGATVRHDKSGFHLRLDTRNYKPDEIEIKQEGNCLCVTGKHEERQDENNGYVSRQFSRRYMLPEDVDVEKLDATFTKKGAVVVTAPKMAIKAAKEQTVPIKRG